MKRLVLIACLHLTMCGLWAQQMGSQFTVHTDFPAARYLVDGQEYQGTVTFMWPEGTIHVIRFLIGDEGYQFNMDRTVRYSFLGWEDSSGRLLNPGGRSQIIIASPEFTSFRAKMQVEYVVRLMFWRSDYIPRPWDPPIVCGVPEGTAPEQYRPGVVFLNDVCYWRESEIWFEPGTYTLTAFPYAGFAFLGWSIDGGGPNSFIRALEVSYPMSLIAHFRPAKRVKFITEPRGYPVLLDRALTPTPTVLPCGNNQTLPPVPVPGVPPLCFGEVDWAVGSTHVIGGPSPYADKYGRDWLFDSFSNGMGNHSVYTVETLLPAETITAYYVRGARVSFLTNPTGLTLGINGRDNFASYNFVAAVGDTYQLSAPEEQTGPDGRRYVFSGWSNGGEATQEVAVPEDAVDNGYRLTAQYEMLSQVVIHSEPAGTAVEVDGVTCDTPCSIDRSDGTEINVTAPARRSVSHVQRLEFASWSDGASRARTIAVSGTEGVNLTANYTIQYRLETSSEPAGGASFVASPSAADGYYDKSTPVTITANAEDGHRFRRWAGDLEGSYHVGIVKMSVPRSVIAMLDEVPFISPAGIRNAAGETPESVVAPGSIISIYGASLAPYIDVGPQNPVAQTLAGVTVWVGDRILPLLFVSAGQINAILHPDLPEGDHELAVTRSGQLDVAGKFTVARNAPGLFSRVFDARLFVMGMHEDGTPITPDSPARRGELISVYGTGFGPYDRYAPYGFALPASPDFLLADIVELFAGELPLQPEWAGGAAGFAGADVLKIRITGELPAASTLELKAHVNGRESNTVLLPIE